MTRRFRWLARRLIRQDQTGAQAFCLSGIILSIRASLRSDYAPARGRPGPGGAGVPAPLAPRSEAGVWTSEGRGWLRRAPSTPAVTSMPATATAREKSRRERARPPVPGKPSLAGPRIIEARRQGPDAGSAPGDPPPNARRLKSDAGSALAGAQAWFRLLETFASRPWLCLRADRSRDLPASPGLPDGRTHTRARRPPERRRRAPGEPAAPIMPARPGRMQPAEPARDSQVLDGCLQLAGLRDRPFQERNHAFQFDVRGVIRKCFPDVV